MPVVHSKVSAKLDSVDTTLVRPSDWNAGHVVSVDLTSEVTGLLPSSNIGTFITMTIDKTITAAGTTGARTINKMMGSVNFAAGAPTLLVTNSLVTISSIIFPTVLTNDGSMTAAQAIPGSGSFLLIANSAPAAETRVGFIVFN